MNIGRRFDAMESQVLTMCRRLVIYVVVFAGFGPFVHGFSSVNEVRRDEAHSDSKSDISPLSHSSTYVMQSYFDGKKHLVKSDFQDFIVREFSSRSCEMLPDNNLSLASRLSIVHRNLMGEGSHRHLSSTLRFNFPPKSEFQLENHFCQVIVVERLPSGVFADPFELQHLHQRGVFTDVAVFGDTNLELPSFLSNQSVVEIHMDVGPNILGRHGNELQINIELPLHARYPPLEESGYSSLKFEDPNLLMRCGIEGKPHNESCLILSTNSSAEFETGAVEWRIPSGIKTHEGFVSVVTFATALLSTLLIVGTSVFSVKFQGLEISKKS